MPPQSFRHVSLRGGIYQYQRRVPKAVIDRPEAHRLYFRGQSIYRKTLGTGVYADALAAAAVAEAEFDGMVQAAQGILPAVHHTPAPKKRELDAAGLADVSSRIRDRVVTDWRGTIVMAGVDPVAAEYLDARIESAIVARDAGDAPVAAIASQAVIRDMARQLNVEMGFGLNERSEGFGELIRAASDGYVQARHDVQTMLEGKALPDAPTSTLINTFGARPNPRSKAMKFSAVVAEQFKVSNFAPKTVQKAKRAHRRFVEVVGDKPIDAITRQDVHAYLNAIAAQEVGRSLGASRPISRTTVQSYLTQISSPLSFAIGRAWREGPNPAADIDLTHWVSASDPALVPAKRRFEIRELNKLFEHPWFAGCLSDSQCYRPGSHQLQDSRYWAPVMALFTGARAAELGGLKISEINVTGIPHIVIQPNEYRRVKSSKRRIVPLLDAFIELGFESYVRRVSSNGSDRLFPDWECPKSRSRGIDDELSRWANAKWIRAFNRTVIPKVFERDPLATRSEITFHSFRGSFKKLMIDHGNHKKANAIIGHTQDDLDRAYLGHFDVEELHEEFHAARFRGLVVPAR